MASDKRSSRERSTRPKSLLDVPEAQRAPMSREVSEVFVRLTFADREAEDMPIAKAWEELRGTASQTHILVGRLTDASDILVRVPTLLFVSYLCATPGRCVLWAYTLAVLTRDLGRAVRVSDLADRFPWGFPTDEGCLAIWDAQKQDRGNHLDSPEVWLAEPVAESAA